MIVRPASRVSPANTATCSRPVSALKAILVKMLTLNSVSAGIARLNGACGFTCGCAALACGWMNSSAISSTVTATVTAVPKCATHRPMPKPGHIHKQDGYEYGDRQRRDQRMALFHPRRARTQGIAEAGRRHDADVGHSEQRPHSEVPRAHEPSERPQRELRPLINAAFQRPHLCTPTHHGRQRNEQEQNRRHPEPDVRCLPVSPRSLPR